MIETTLPIELTNGNDGRGSRWYKTATTRKKIEQLLRAAGLQRTPFEFAVDVHLTRVLGKGQRLFDADSLLRGNSKELIDALVAVGWFYDDGPKYIKKVTADQDANQRDNGPCVIVRVTAAESNWDQAMGVK
jgi:hypothetical protein